MTNSASPDFIYHEIYKEKLRAKFMEAMSDGGDFSVDANGDIIVIKTKLVFQHFKWNVRTQSFEKVYTGVKKKRANGGKAKGKADVVDGRLHPVEEELQKEGELI